MPDAVGESGSFDQLHHQKVGTDVVERADVGVVQRSDRAGFALEAFREALGGNFDGYFPAQAGIAGAVDFAHAAGSERGQHLVRAKGLAGRQQGHGLGDYIWVELLRRAAVLINERSETI